MDKRPLIVIGVGALAVMALRDAQAKAKAQSNAIEFTGYGWEYETLPAIEVIPETNIANAVPPATNGGDGFTKFISSPLESIMSAFSKLTRGERNNNPGNIVRNNIKWQGMSPDQSGDGRFVVFQSPEYGVRALGRVLQSYAKQGHNTIRLIVKRYAPPIENNTDAYIASVVKQTGFDPDAVLNFANRATLTKIVNAIIQHENGRNAYAGTGIVETGLSMMG